MTEKRVLVCGSRGWTDSEVIHRELSKLSGNIVVIHGAAKGADTIAGEIAEQLGFRVIACPPEWARYGKAAGPIRNQQMLEQERPELVLAFAHDLSRSPGTRHMIQIARKAGIQVRVFEESKEADALELAPDKTASETAGGKRIIAFTKVNLPFGWLSNMSPHVVKYKGDEYATAEALFQCLRFDDEQIQNEIWEQTSPMAAKMVAKKHRQQIIIEPRGDQDVENMGLTLMLKIEQHAEIRKALINTGDAQIIEDCTKRQSQSGLFWGAAQKECGWIGENRLGKLWMELRGEILRGEW